MHPTFLSKKLSEVKPKKKKNHKLQKHPRNLIRFFKEINFLSQYKSKAADAIHKK